MGRQMWRPHSHLQASHLNSGNYLRNKTHLQCSSSHCATHLLIHLWNPLIRPGTLPQPAGPHFPAERWFLVLEPEHGLWSLRTWGHQPHAWTCNSRQVTWALVPHPKAKVMLSTTKAVGNVNCIRICSHLFSRHYFTSIFPACFRQRSVCKKLGYL